MSSKEQEKIRADEATVLLLDKLLTEVQKQTPEGIVEPLPIKLITTVNTIITPTYKDKPWFSVSIVNDGPNDCWVVVNTEKSSTTPYLLKVDETFEVDFGVATIHDILVWCETGSASLRVRGVR